MTRYPDEVLTRFWAKVDKESHPDGCWQWTASCRTAGYGQFVYPRGHNRVAHRLAYELLVGAIPHGLDLDHLCRNRACVNPAHLEPVTRSENLRRGVAARLTHCPQGHPRNAANTWTKPSTGRSECRVCMNERSRQWRRARAVA